MGRIKIKDLPENVEISEEEMKKMTGGGLLVSGIGYSCAPPLNSSRLSFGETSQIGNCRYQTCGCIYQTCGCIYQNSGG